MVPLSLKISLAKVCSLHHLPVRPIQSEQKTKTGQELLATVRLEFFAANLLLVYCCCHLMASAMTLKPVVVQVDNFTVLFPASKL